MKIRGKNVCVASKGKWNGVVVVDVADVVMCAHNKYKISEMETKLCGTIIRRKRKKEKKNYPLKV